MKKKLKKLIRKSESFSNIDEKNEFTLLIDFMNKKQLKECKKIFENENLKLQKIRKKYWRNNKSNLSKKEFYKLIF